MKKQLVIRSIISGGYWDGREKGNYRGFLYAYNYSSNTDPKLLKDLEIASIEPCEIITVYINENIK
jgi:hypothetical protein